MFEASYDTNENYNTYMEIINRYGLSAEDVLNHLTDWCGLEILSHDFMENLIDCEL